MARNSQETKFVITTSPHSVYGKGANPLLMHFEDKKAANGYVNGHYSPLVQTDALREPTYLTQHIAHLYPEGYFSKR